MRVSASEILSSRNKVVPASLLSVVPLPPRGCNNRRIYSEPEKREGEIIKPAFNRNYSDPPPPTPTLYPRRNKNPTFLEQPRIIRRGTKVRAKGAEVNGPGTMEEERETRGRRKRNGRRRNGTERKRREVGAFTRARKAPKRRS